MTRNRDIAWRKPGLVIEARPADIIPPEIRRRSLAERLGLARQDTQAAIAADREGCPPMEERLPTLLPTIHRGPHLPR